MQVPGGAVSLNIFKLYMGRMLGQLDQGSDTDLDQGSDTDSSALLDYHHSTWLEVGNVLSASPDLGPPGPYIPKFYRDCSSIKLMPDSEVSVMLNRL